MLDTQNPVIVLSRLRKYLVLGAASSVFLVGATVSWFAATKAPQIVASEAIACDTEWLIEPSPDLEYSSKQVSLYLNNNDPTSCSTIGLRQSSVRRQALIYISEAVKNTSNPKHKCNKGTVVECLESFGQNIGQALRKATTEEEIGKQYFKLEALIIAADAYINGNVELKPSEFSPTLASALLENYFRDYRASSAISSEGIVKEMRERREEEKRAEQEIQSGTVPLKRKGGKK